MRPIDHIIPPKEFDDLTSRFLRLEEKSISSSLWVRVKPRQYAFELSDLKGKLRKIQSSEEIPLYSPLKVLMLKCHILSQVIEILNVDSSKTASQLRRDAHSLMDRHAQYLHEECRQFMLRSDHPCEAALELMESLNIQDPWTHYEFAKMSAWYDPKSFYQNFRHFQLDEGQLQHALKIAVEKDYKSLFAHLECVREVSLATRYEMARIIVENKLERLLDCLQKLNINESKEEAHRLTLFAASYNPWSFVHMCKRQELLITDPAENDNIAMQLACSDEPWVVLANLDCFQLSEERKRDVITCVAERDGAAIVSSIDQLQFLSPEERLHMLLIASRTDPIGVLNLEKYDDDSLVREAAVLQVFHHFLDGKADKLRKAIGRDNKNPFVGQNQMIQTLLTLHQEPSLDVNSKEVRALFSSPSLFPFQDHFQDYLAEVEAVEDAYLRKQLLTWLLIVGCAMQWKGNWDESMLSVIQEVLKLRDPGLRTSISHIILDHPSELPDREESLFSFLWRANQLHLVESDDLFRQFDKGAFWKDSTKKNKLLSLLASFERCSSLPPEEKNVCLNVRCKKNHRE